MIGSKRRVGALASVGEASSELSSGAGAGWCFLVDIFVRGKYLFVVPHQESQRIMSSKGRALAWEPAFPRRSYQFFKSLCEHAEVRVCDITSNDLAYIENRGQKPAILPRKHTNILWADCV